MKNKEDEKSLKTFWKKFWFLIWKDDSWRGWIFSVLFLFIFIKFIFFPILGFLAGTSLPLAIVESCSMHHNGNLVSDFDSWWEKGGKWYEDSGITKQEFQEFPSKNGFNKGDIFFIIGTKPEKLNIGDIIVFNGGRKNPIIHRVVGLNPLQTKGDNWKTNSGQLRGEQNIQENQLIGKAVFKLAPYLGWGKLIFFEKLKPVPERGLCSNK